MIAAGDRLPDTPLPDVGGQTHALAKAWSQGPAVVVVGHRNCKTTRQTLPYVDRLYRRRGPDHGVVVVLQDDPDTARQVISEQSLQVPTLLDLDPYRLGATLGLQTVPTLMLVGRDGVVQQVSEGFSRADLETFARGLAVKGPLFSADDDSPAYRPG